MKIDIASKASEFVVEYSGGAFIVTAKDKEDESFAATATEVVERAVRLDYSPAYGDMLAFAAKIAAKVLKCKIVADIPPGAGELEQAFGQSSRAFCPTGSGGGVDNSCSSKDGGGGEAGSGGGEKSAEASAAAAEKAYPKAFPAESRKFRQAIDKVVEAEGRDPEQVWDRAKGLAETPAARDIDEIASEQQAQTGKPLTSEAREAYDSLLDEIGKQYEAILDSGVSVRAWKGEGEPYGDPPGSTKPNSDGMRAAVARDSEYKFFMTEKGFGTGAATPDHPMLRETRYKTSDGEPMIANDVFRVVHDFVAHVRGGYSFSTNGEYNGMLTHASTLPERAWPALFAETFGQNAVYEKTGGYAAQNAYASRVGAQRIKSELSKRSKRQQRAQNMEDGDEPLGYQHLKTRPWLARAARDSRAFCATGQGGGVDNSCSSKDGGGGGGGGESGGIIDQVAKSGGLSIRVDSGAAPVKGYMVAKQEYSHIVPADDFFKPEKGEKIVADYIKKHRAVLDSPDTYLGLWHDKSSGKIYFDIADNIRDRAEAERKGRRRNQIAIWDVENQDTINTGGTGE